MSQNFTTVRQLVRLMLEASTPKLADLTPDDISMVLQDILGREPLASYTEKLAGQHLAVEIRGGEVLARFKDDNPGDENTWADIAGVRATIKNSTIPAAVPNISFKFEVIKNDRRPDYIDYVIGDKNIAIEYTGKMTSEMASDLNGTQSRLKFLTQRDITKRPRPLSPETRLQLEEYLAKIDSGMVLSKEEKKSLELTVSGALMEIFGESVLGGPPEGIFVSGTKKPFKIPEKTYADLQRLMAPLYATFSDKSSTSIEDVYDRLRGLAAGEVDPGKDRMIGDIERYLTAASAGFPPGYRTFMEPSEASRLLSMLRRVKAGDGEPIDGLVRTLRSKVRNKDGWVSTGRYKSQS